MNLSRNLAIALALSATTACTSLPDTSGYTAASLQLKQSAAAAGSVLEAELGRMAEYLPADRRDGVGATVQRFGAAWGTTVASLDAMARYAESIEEITAAGNDGGAAARGVAQGIQQLAGAVGLVPGAAVATLATDTAAAIYTQIANVRASRSLVRSLDAAEPIIRDVAVVVTGQVDAAARMFNNLISAERSVLEADMEDVLRIDQRLEQQEKQLGQHFAALSEESGPAAARAAAQAELDRVRNGRSAIAPRIAAYNAARAALGARETAGAELFAATRLALTTWESAHQKMTTAIRERRPVTFQSLQAAATDVRAILERWRDL